MHNICCIAINIMHLWISTLSALPMGFCFAAVFLLHIITETARSRLGLRFVFLIDFGIL